MSVVLLSVLWRVFWLIFLPGSKEGAQSSSCSGKTASPQTSRPPSAGVKRAPDLYCLLPPPDKPNLATTLCLGPLRLLSSVPSSPFVSVPTRGPEFSGHPSPQDSKPHVTLYFPLWPHCPAYRMSRNPFTGLAETHDLATVNSPISSTSFQNVPFAFLL